MSAELLFEVAEVAARCGIEVQVVVRYVQRCWVIPFKPAELIFDHEDIARIQLICDLQTNLDINDEAVPIILHLIDQLNCLHLNIK